MSKKPHKNYTQEDIERYFSGQMSAKEMRDIEAYALEDPFLSDAMEGYENNLNPATEAHLKEIKEKILLFPAAGIVPVNKSTKWWKYTLAASVLLCVIGAVYLVFNDGRKENMAVSDQAPALTEQYIDTTEAIDNLLIAENADTAIPHQKDAIAIKGAQQKKTRTDAALSPVLEETFIEKSLQGKAPGISAERRQLKVQVKDDNNNPLPNISVSVKNSGGGVLTNNNGEFSIHINNNDTLLLSSLGHERKEIPVAAIGKDIVLQPDRYAADEVVVVGYGTQKKSRITGALPQKDVYQKRESSDDALAANVSGVRNQSNKREDESVRMRGYAPVKTTEPMVVINGRVASITEMKALNKKEITSIKFLKAAEAMAIYGSKGMNGVIIITTSSEVRKDTSVNRANMKKDSLSNLLNSSK